MSLLGQVLRIMDRMPPESRRFNLLREEPPPGRQRGLSALAPFVLFASLPLAGFWQVQSDLDPSLTRPKLSGQSSDLDGNTSARPASVSESLLGREDSKSMDSRPLPQNHGRRLRGHDLHVSSLRASRGAHNVQTKEQVFYRKAQGYHKRKNFEMAVELYRQVLQENPRNRDALLHLSSIYMDQSAYAKAYPLLSELVGGDPRDPQALVNLAIAEIALGRPEKAIADLDRALTLEDPPRFEIYFHQGVALSSLQRLEEAVTWYKKSEDLDPGHAPLLFNMAVTFDKLERYEDALNCYARFLKASVSSSPQERRDVGARIGVLMAYLAAKTESFAERDTH
jgi:tetratricopeptide (TPR) repeat protein